jgi:hypothetical protein
VTLARRATLIVLMLGVVALLAWPVDPLGDGWWVVTVGSNEAEFVPVGVSMPRLGLAALRGDPLSTADRLRLGVAGVLAFGALMTWLTSADRAE